MAACLSPQELRQGYYKIGDARIPLHKVAWYRRQGYKPIASYEYIRVPCGKCAACLSNRANDWAFRLDQQLKHSVGACYFITLTYDDEHLVYNTHGIPTFSKEHIQMFIKDLRNDLRPHKIKYFAVSEYGETFGRPHYHLLLFDYPYSHTAPGIFPKDKLIGAECIKRWTHGQVDIGEVTNASITYCTKYCISKLVLPENWDQPFMLCSQGLGKSWLQPENIESYRKHFRTSVRSNGRVAKTPRYYTNVLNDFDLEANAIRNRAMLQRQTNADYLYWQNRWESDEAVKDYERKVFKRLNKQLKNN